jgi:hypothetical protein
MRKKIVHKLGEKFGSQAEVARICGVDPASVCRWLRVPVKHHSALLRAARERKISLDHMDLIGNV